MRLKDRLGILVDVMDKLYPEVTGVYSNRQYQPIPKGLSIFERLEGHFSPDKFVTVAVNGSRLESSPLLWYKHGLA